MFRILNIVYKFGKVILELRVKYGWRATDVDQNLSSQITNFI
jgi:hypothetical protein